MNRHALEVLQFGDALDVVAGHASSPLGAEAVRALEPQTDGHVVRRELQRVDEMRAWVERASDWQMGVLPDARAGLRRLHVQGSMLDARELRDVAHVLRSSAGAQKALQKHGGELETLGELAERLIRLDAEERRIGAAVDEGGEVRDTASPELSRLRREIRGARSRIVERLEQYAAGLPSRFQVQDASVTVRDGRFVIPIRREGRSEVGGLVHDESATGATLFVEPPVAIELMNRVRELELAEVREVNRILRELTEMLRDHADAVAHAFAALVELDSRFARARYAHRVDGYTPRVEAGGARLVLVNARHPLLLAGGAAVVPFDLAMEPGERTLLISGPNTGGKTVLLKAVGLIAALAQAGVIPPVGPGSVLPLFDDIFGDIGDEQSIEASLSTFSAHLRNLREILDGAHARTLALIDEMGSGTDPAEGGALAEAILRTLTRRGTLTFASTHLGQLKELAATEPGVVNASLQFDSTELRPTYRLLKGVPGRSYGLAIARRLGLPGDVLDAAEGALPTAERRAGQLLEELETKDRLLETALADARNSEARARLLEAELKERETALRNREREAERRARQQARDLLLNAREEVDAAIREFRAAAAAEGVDLDDAARAARRRVEQGARREAERAPRETPRAPARDVREGSHVKVTATGLKGVVVELRDDRATVEVNGLRMQVPVNGLEAAAAPQPAKHAAVARGNWSAPDLEASHEVDLRGLRADEVTGQLHPALDGAIQAGLPTLRIIHGKGTGALREVVAEVLRADARVASFRAGGIGEGGTGVTVAELR